MKAAFLAEFHTIKSIVLQMLGLYLLVGLIIGAAMQNTLAMASCIAAMTPFMLIFTLAGYDDMNGWARFRACLPVSRNAIVCARYGLTLIVSLAGIAVAVAASLALQGAANVLPLPDDLATGLLESANDPMLIVESAFAGMAAILVVASLIMPFIVRYGLTRATRIIPVLLVLLIPVVIALKDYLDLGGLAAQLVELLSTGGGRLVALAVASAIVLALYALSCFAACRMYRKKEL